MEQINSSSDLNVIQNRIAREKKEKRFQSTLHQQEAIKTAQAFNDMDHKGWYFRIFKQQRHQLEKMAKCREWVLRSGADNFGALFISEYNKFLKPFEEKK